MPLSTPNESFPLLSILIFSPLIAAAIAACIRSETLLRWWTLAFTSVAAIFSLELWRQFDPGERQVPVRRTLPLDSPPQD